MRVYVASSWKNDRQPEVVSALRRAGHEAYDFRQPDSGRKPFRWDELSQPSWNTAAVRGALCRPEVCETFQSDMAALRNSEAVVLVLPAGRSAHLEFGWAVGAGRRSIVLLADQEPELMYGMAEVLCETIEEVVEALHLPPGT
jgi:hypothetical protein